MKHKTELHAHTSEVSLCAELSTVETVNSYIKNGYSTLVIANHYSSMTFENMESSTWQEKNAHFLSAYNIARECAGSKINIILGMELRNIYSANDYLIYGVTEDFINEYSYDDDNNFLKMHLKDFCSLAHKHNILVFQAHPFRNGMKIVNPEYLDGIEVLNGHPRHDSRNDIAALWAEKFGLLKCGGSDSHCTGDEATVALVTDYEIKTSSQLTKALKSDVLLEYIGDK